MNLKKHKDSTTKSSGNLGKIKSPQENYPEKSIKATVGLIKCEYCREKVEKNKTNKHDSECLKAAKKISDSNQCLICSSKFDKKFEAFKHVKLDHPDIFLSPKVLNIDGLDSKIEVKKEPLIKTANSFGIEPTFGLHVGSEKVCNGLKPISNKQTDLEIINIDGSEDDEIDDVEPASSLPMGLLDSQNSLEPRDKRRYIF